MTKSLRLALIASGALGLFMFPACGGSGSGSPVTPPPAPPPPPPPPAPNPDSTSVVIGAAGGVVTVPTAAAGVQIPAGVLSQSTTVTISRLTASTTPGAGPLPTTLKQYPPYYEISTNPANAQLGDFVRVGVCQVSDPSSPLYPPEATHDRLRLAHRVGSTIEILERVDVSDFLRCTSVVANAPGNATGFRFAGALLGKLLAEISPRDAYAAHGGLGGKVKSFSPFAGVDPGPNTNPTVFKVDPRASFLLRESNDPSAQPSLMIDLSSLGLVAGDQIRLERLGDYSIRVNDPETSTAMIAVFSSINVLLGPQSRNRVPGSINAGLNFVTQPTIANSLETDIPDDFFVASLTVRVPVGARYLFVGTPDPYAGDNGDVDANFAIRLTPVP
jgi:hypothetical protein